MYIVFRADTLGGSVAHLTETNIDVRIALKTWRKKSGLHPHFDAVLKNDVLTFFHINVQRD